MILTDTPRLAGRLVLVVDDNAEFADVVTTALEENGARTSTATTLTQAQAAVLAEAPDAIVCDLVLPDGNGVDFLHWLRGQPLERGGEAAVVAVTGFPHAFPPGRWQGFAAYVTKPVDIDDLCRTVGALFGRP